MINYNQDKKNHSRLFLNQIQSPYICCMSGLVSVFVQNVYFAESDFVRLRLTMKTLWSVCVRRYRSASHKRLSAVSFGFIETPELMLLSSCVQNAGSALRSKRCTNTFTQSSPSYHLRLQVSRKQNVEDVLKPHVYKCQHLNLRFSLSMTTVCVSG